MHSNGNLISNYHIKSYLEDQFSIILFPCSTICGWILPAKSCTINISRHITLLHVYQETGEQQYKTIIACYKSWTIALATKIHLRSELCANYFKRSKATANGIRITLTQTPLTSFHAMPLQKPLYKLSFLLVGIIISCGLCQQIDYWTSVLLSCLQMRTAIIGGSLLYCCGLVGALSMSYCAQLLLSNCFNRQYTECFVDSEHSE